MKHLLSSRRALLAFLGLAACAPSHGQPAGRIRGRDIAYGDHPRQKLDIYGPEASSPAPVLIFFHGGAWIEGGKEENESIARAFAAQGYYVVVPNYRLSPEVHFPAFIEDSARAVRWTQDHAAEFGADPSRIVLCGYSAGAYLAAMLALDMHYLADAGVEARAILGVIGISGAYDFYPFTLDAAREAFGRAPDPTLTQPVHFARGDAPPMFLAWGETDALIDRRNIDNMARALREVGGDVETHLYPGLDHGGIWFALTPDDHAQSAVFTDAIDFANRITQRR